MSPKTVADLQAVLALNSDKFQSGVKEAQAATGRMGSAITGLGKVAAVAGLALGGALVAGLAGAGAAAFSVASDVKQATNEIKAQLGATEEEAAALGEVVKNVFADNWGDSIEDVAQSLITLKQAVGDLVEDADLEPLVAGALALRDAFGIEVMESASVAATLMEEFGLSGEEALDLIAKGMQDGLNANDDFLDSLGEYSNIFKDAGFSAEEMYSIMETGAKGGVLGTDKVTDAIKEMTIRLNEGAGEVSDAFGDIGLDFEEIQRTVRSGESTWADHFDAIVDGINAIEDPIERQKAQVAIFGTMAEDLGVSFTEGLSSTQTALSDTEGAIDSLNAKYDNLPAAVEGMKRRVLVQLEPVGAKLLELANNIMPDVERSFMWLGERLPGWIDAALRPVNLLRDGIITAQLALRGEWAPHPSIHRLHDVVGRIASFLHDGELAWNNFKFLVGEGIPVPEALAQQLGTLIPQEWADRIAGAAGSLSHIKLQVEEIAKAFDPFKKALQYLGGEAIGEIQKFVSGTGEANFPAVTTILRSLGKALADIGVNVPALTNLTNEDVVAGMGALAEKGNSLAEALFSIGLGLATFYTLSKGIAVVGAITTAFATFGGAVKAAGGVLGALAAILAGSVTAALVLVGGVVTLIAWLWIQKFGGINEAISAFTKHLSDSKAEVDEFETSTKAAIQRWYDGVAVNIETMIGWIERLVGWIERAIGAFNRLAGVQTPTLTLPGTGGGGGPSGENTAALARGGPVSAHVPYLVGEQGAELFVPRAAGRIIPHAESMALLGAGGNGNRTTINLYPVLRSESDYYRLLHDLKTMERQARR